MQVNRQAAETGLKVRQTEKTGESAMTNDRKLMHVDRQAAETGLTGGLKGQESRWNIRMGSGGVQFKGTVARDFLLQLFS